MNGLWPSSGVLGSPHGAFSMMFRPCLPGSPHLPSSFELARIEIFARATWGGRTVNTWLPGLRSFSSGYVEVPHTLSIAQIWGWGQPSGQTLETGGNHLLPYNTPPSDRYRPFSRRGVRTKDLSCLPPPGPSPPTPEITIYIVFGQPTSPAHAHTQPSSEDSSAGLSLASSWEELQFESL